MGSGRQGRKFVNSFVVPGYNGSQGTINTFVSLSELFLSLADFFFCGFSKIFLFRSTLVCTYGQDAVLVDFVAWCLRY